MHNDPVDSPEHYQFGQLEAWDIIELAVADIHDPVTAYHVASALKYLLRAARKGGNTDIAKASAHLKRETARHVAAKPDYDPASMAFRHGDLGWIGEAAVSEVCEACSEVCEACRIRGVLNPGATVPKTAAEIADADGAGEYGNPVTPGCAPWRLP